MKRIIWILILIAIVGIQLIPVNRPELIKDNAGDLLTSAIVPDSIARMLRTSCYDCHSNETDYPWYAHVAPVSWLVSRDVRKGRADLNFSTWKENSKMQKAKILSEIADEIESGDMPMKIYPLMHAEAKLTQAKRDAIIEWTNAYGESLFE